MSQPRTHRTRALTVAAGIVACVLGGAAYTVPADGEPKADSSAVAAEDAPAEAQDEAEVEGTDAAPTAEREFEHEYEPEPEPTPSPAAAETDAEPATALPPGPDVEHEYEPEPEPVATPAAPEPAPTPDATPDSPSAPTPGEDAEEPTSPEAAEHPVAVAGSPAPHPGPPPPADDAPGEAPGELDGPDDPDVAGAAGGSERTRSSARAMAPSSSMTALRSSTVDSFDDDEVLAPLVAPREVARADTSARRVAAVTPADRELLASAGHAVAAPAGPAAFDGSTGAPSPAMILASALLTLVAAASAGTYFLQRRRAR